MLDKLPGSITRTDPRGHEKDVVGAHHAVGLGPTEPYDIGHPGYGRSRGAKRDRPQSAEQHQYGCNDGNVKPDAPRHTCRIDSQFHSSDWAQNGGLSSNDLPILRVLVQNGNIEKACSIGRSCFLQYFSVLATQISDKFPHNGNVSGLIWFAAMWQWSQEG